MPEHTVFCINITLAEADLPAFWAVFTPVYEQIIAEPQNTFFEVAQDPAAPGSLTFWEGWSESVEWLMANQMTKPYYAPYREITGAMFIKPIEVKVLKRVPRFIKVGSKHA